MLKKEFDRRKSNSYSELLCTLFEIVEREAAENKKKALDLTKEKSGFGYSLGITKHEAAEESKVEPNPTLEAKQKEPKLVRESDIIDKEAKELAQKCEYEAEDEYFMEQNELQRILIGYFKLEPKEADTFIYEIIKLSVQKIQSKVSVRTIKDCIMDARLDDGRLFLFLSQKHTSLKLAVSDISNPYKMMLLYCPNAYEPVESVACGECHLLLLTCNGTIYSCGDSTQGALGLGSIQGNVNVPLPVIIKKHNGTRKAKMVAAGRDHSMCLTTHNEIFTWGNGIKGKLGHGNESEQKYPKEITIIHQHTPIFISAGDSHSACVTASGKLFTWGDGEYGKLGHSNTQTVLSPMRVLALSEVEIVTVSCGAFHTLAVDKAGMVWSFGQPKGEKLVDADHTNTPQVVIGCKDVKSALAGIWNSYAVNSKNEVYSWGSSEKGMLGHKIDASQPNVPKMIKWLTLAKGIEIKTEGVKEASVSSKVAQVVCSYNNTFVVTDAGEVYAFGSNEYKQFGVESKKLKQPFKLPVFTPETNNQVKMLSCGFSHVLAVTTHSKLYAWGANDCGQLGNGRKDPAYEPTPVDTSKLGVVVFCACGDDYSAAITESGELFTFGSHEKGRLGIGPVDADGCELIPQKVELPGFPHIKSVCCGVNHVLAIPDYDSEDPSGNKGIWSWGMSSRGQLGHGTQGTFYSPKLIQKLAKERIQKVCCGFEHSMALTESGKVYYWGAQEYYLRSEFDSRNMDKLEPVQMQASSTDKILDIAASHMYNLAIGTGKEVIYWGHFLAAGSKKKKSVGIVIESKLGTKAEQISCGPNHAAIIGFGDCLYTWGYDYEGSLGLNMKRTDYQPTPERVWTIKEVLEKGAKKLRTQHAKTESMDQMRAVPVSQIELEKVQDEDEEESFSEEEKKVIIEEAKKEESVAKKHSRKVKKSSQLKASELPETANALILQKQLKTASELTQEKLMNFQKEIKRLLDKVLRMFKDIVKITEEQKLMIQSFTINLISRLENGPFKKKRRLHLLTNRVKVIKEYKEQLKEIFKALYLHPCYLSNLMRSPSVDSVFMGDLVTSLYANNADKKYTRVLLMNLALLVFKYEFSKDNKRELVNTKDYSATPTLFSKIFDLIFLNDPKCINYAAGLAGLCFNDMYRVVMQRFPDEAATCFAEMSGKKVHESNKKTIESKLKTRCESIRSILERIRQRFAGDLEPDKQAGAMFIGEGTYRLSNIVKNLLADCEKVIRKGYREPKGNVELFIATKLLPLVFKHACNVLKKPDLLLLYNLGDKNKEDSIQQEVRKQADNAQTLANVLMCYVTATKACEFWGKIGNFRMVQEFNRELKGTEDRLIDIFREIATRGHRATFLKSYFANSCHFERTVVSFSPDQIKSLFIALEKHAGSLALIRPIDKDPIYKNTQLINLDSMENMRPSQKVINFRIRTHPLQDDPSLSICETCNTFVTRSTSTPYCKKFVDEVQRLDSLSPIFLYTKLLMKADEALINDAEPSVDKIGELAKKRDHLEVVEICEELSEVFKKTYAKDAEKQLDEVRVAAIQKYNERRGFNISLHQKKMAITLLKKRVKNKLKHQHAHKSEVYPSIVSHLQYGLANTELEDPARVGQGLSLVRAAVNYVESLIISPELFEHLLVKEKQQLKPFVKKRVSTLISRDVIQAVRIPNIEPILSKCSLVMSFSNLTDLEIQLVYQESKDAICGSLKSEIEAKLFTYNFTVQNTYEVFKAAHKYNPNVVRTLTIEKNDQSAIHFGLYEFMKLYGKICQQAVAYIHRTKSEKTEAKSNLAINDQSDKD